MYRELQLVGGLTEIDWSSNNLPVGWGSLLQGPQGGDLHQKWNLEWKSITEHQKHFYKSILFDWWCLVVLKLPKLVSSLVCIASPFWVIYINDRQVFDNETSCLAMKTIFIAPSLAFIVFFNSHYNLICRRCTFSCAFPISRSILVAVKTSTQALVRGNAALINWLHLEHSARASVHPSVHAATHSLWICMFSWRRKNNPETEPRGGEEGQSDSEESSTFTDTNTASFIWPCLPIRCRTYFSTPEKKHISVQLNYQKAKFYPHWLFLCLCEEKPGVSLEKLPLHRLALNIS